MYILLRIRLLFIDYNSERTHSQHLQTYLLLLCEQISFVMQYTS